MHFLITRNGFPFALMYLPFLRLCSMNFVLTLSPVFTLSVLSSWPREPRGSRDVSVLSILNKTPAVVRLTSARGVDEDMVLYPLNHMIRSGV